jgi:DNA invertase Pin-like site-specific DNA recombinase
MLDRLGPGDVVTAARIDRLARSTFDLFGIVKQIVDAKAQFWSLAEPWFDTGTSTGRLMIAVLGLTGGRERDFIRTPHRRGPQPGAEARAANGPYSELTVAQQIEAGRGQAEGSTLPNLPAAAA